MHVLVLDISDKSVKCDESRLSDFLLILQQIEHRVKPVVCIDDCARRSVLILRDSMLVK